MTGAPASRSATRAPASCSGSWPSRWPPTWSGGRGGGHEPAGRARGRGARRRRRGRAVRARRPGHAPAGPHVPVRHAGGEPERRRRARRPGRGRAERRRLPDLGDRTDRRLHDVQHVDAREPPARRGRARRAGGPERRGQPRRRDRRRVDRAPDRRRGAMSGDGSLKLTVLFGERARADGGFLADALVGIFARHRLRTSLVLRGIEGFGAKHQLRTDRLLTLSEDLPMLALAVDRRAAIEAALADVRALPTFSGLVTLERALLLAGDELARPHGDAAAILTGRTAKLTVYVGRQERAGGGPAQVAVVDLLHRRGIAGATVLLGVDGTAGGERRRARFFARNAAVPVMVVAVGDGD